MRFGLLGPLAVWTDEGAAVTVPGTKVRALLADLLVHSPEPVSADRLVEALWEGEPPAKATAALQSKVSQLRAALGRAEPDGRELVASTPAGYVLRVAAGAVDADRFAAAVASARRQTEPAAVAAGLAEALTLWRGPALADHADEPFALSLARRLEEQRIAAVEDLVEARLALGEHASLVGELDELVRCHPQRERLRGAHMRALYGAGRQADALASYEELRVRLVEELGLVPGPELARLQRAILVQDRDLDTPRPTIRSTVDVAAAGRPRTNLPASLSRLVGRDAAIDDVLDRVSAGRLVTLTGPGGVGKTRLALAAAHGRAHASPGRPALGWADGTARADPGDAGESVEPSAPTDRLSRGADLAVEAVWLVELAGWLPTADGGGGARGLAEHVGAVLGIADVAVGGSGPAAAGRSLDVVGRLAQALGDRPVLLVLDNCEHVVAPVAALVLALLEAAPALRILATSREPLGVPGELLWPVPPLDLPVGDAGDSLEASGAVQLFVERAAAAVPGFTLDDGNASAVATICRRLDGLPLALELAAARVRGLGVHALAERLDDRFALLAGGEGWAPARHRTLRAVVDWSWDLLDPDEQAVLRRVAVHADSFTLSAAEAVAGDESVTAGQVAGLLARLVDRSLVVAEEAPAGLRYRLLETIREYAIERLAVAGMEGDGARARHARHHVELAEEADRHLRGPDQRCWLERLDTEAANVRLALDEAVGRNDAALAMRLVGAMSWYWYLRGRHREGHRAVRAALATDGPVGGARGDALAKLRALATVWCSVLGLVLFMEDDREDMWRSVLRLYDEVDDDAGRARARWLLAMVLFDTDQSAAAVPLAEQALAGYRRAGDEWGVAAALNVLGWTALSRSELDEARGRGETSLALFRDVGDRWGQVRADELLGVLAEIAGDLDRAEELHRDGLRLAEEMGLWPAAVDHLGRLGRLATARGDYATADALNHRALTLARDVAFEQGVEFAHIGLGLSARREGRLDDAERNLQIGADAHRANGFRPGLAFALAELGFVAELRGDVATARARHLEGLGAARASGDARSVALAFEGLAGVAALAQRPEDAAHLLGAASSIRISVGAPRPAAERADVDRITAATRTTLAEADFAAAFALGEERGLDAEV